MEPFLRPKIQALFYFLRDRAAGYHTRRATRNRVRRVHKRAAELRDVPAARGRHRGPIQGLRDKDDRSQDDP